MSKKNLTHATPKEMVLCSLRKSVIILGVITEERQKSMKERLANRKYIGEWRWRSEIIRSTVKLLPKMVIK